MATKNFRSTVLEPTSEFAYGDKLRFTALATVSEVLKGSFSETTIGEDGVYSVDLQYGKHRIDYKPYEGVWRHFADVEVNADTLSTTLQDLALASAPVTDETILVLQGILADAEAAMQAAEAAAESSENASALAESILDSAVKTDDLGNVVIKNQLSVGDCVKNLASLRSPDASLDWILIRTKIPFGKTSATINLELSCRGTLKLTYTANHTIKISHYFFDGAVYGANAYTDTNYQIPAGFNKYKVINDAGFYAYAIPSSAAFTVTAGIYSSATYGDADYSEKQNWTIEKLTNAQIDAMDVRFDGVISQLSYQSATATSIVSSIEHEGITLYSVDAAQAKEIGIPEESFNSAYTEQENARLFESEKAIALQIMSDYQLGLYSITEQDITDTKLYIQSIEPLAVASSQRASMPRPQVFIRYKTNPYEL